MNQYHIESCKLIELPGIVEPRGNLSFIESAIHIPFDIMKVYLVNDVPEGMDRRGHAHKNLNQVIIAASARIEIILDDGRIRKSYILNKPFIGLYICP